LKKPFGTIQHRRAQLMQAGERQFHFRLHARRALDPAALAGAPAGQVLQQCGLAHARVTAYHQRPAVTGPDPGDKPVQYAALGMAVRQWSRAAPAAAAHGHSSTRIELVATSPGPPLPTPSPLTES
jgi:hypothetical protein